LSRRVEAVERAQAVDATRAAVVERVAAGEEE